MAPTRSVIRLSWAWKAAGNLCFANVFGLERDDRSLRVVRMMGRALDIEKVRVFVAIVEAGSFSAAARRLNRAQSAVTYAIQELEADLGLSLFDRSGYRPVPSDAGHALLPNARRILRAASAMRLQADGFLGGLETELSLVLDPMVPLSPLTPVLQAFQQAFPSVTIRVHVEALGSAADMIADGRASLGLVVRYFVPEERLEVASIGSVELVVVCAPHHPLVRVAEAAAIEDHLQLVLTDRSRRTQGRDHGVSATVTWRIADLGAKHAMLREGLGWGSLPRHMAQDDLASGRLVALDLAKWSGAGPPPKLDIVVARRVETPLGPAARWLYAALRDDARLELTT